MTVCGLVVRHGLSMVIQSFIGKQKMSDVYKRQLLVNESTPYHDAIPDILKTYDRVTGLWPESHVFLVQPVESDFFYIHFAAGGVRIAGKRFRHIGAVKTQFLLQLH